MEIVVTAASALLGTIIGGLISYFTSERSSKRNIELEMNKMKVSYLMSKFDHLKNIIKEYHMDYIGDAEADEQAVYDDYNTISRLYTENIFYLSDAMEDKYLDIIEDIKRSHNDNSIEHNPIETLYMSRDFNVEVDKLFRDELSKTRKELESLTN